MTDYLLDRLTVAVGAHYLIEGEIGRGGMAVVYRALDLRLQRPVAIKVLPPDLAYNTDVRARFLREAQTAAQLNHPNIVPIYAVDESDALVYFVMALVDGESLAALLGREPRLGIDHVARILREVADGLGYAHDHGVVHRDIKPDNILLDRASGRAVVTDFGIARAAAESRLTVTGVAVGTPAYMSPEQAMGEHEVDGRSDIYSLGIVGYQMLVGETPFRASNTPAMLMKHVSEPPPPLRARRPDVPPVLAIVVERALAKRPADRWATAHEIRDALAGDLHSHDRALPWVHEPIRVPAVVPPDVAGPAVVRLDTSSARVAADPAAALRARIERRVSRFRHSIVTAAILVPVFFVLGVAVRTAGVFFIPSAVLVFSVLWRAGRLWANDISPFTALRSNWRARLFGATALAASRAGQPLVAAAASARAARGAAVVQPPSMADPDVMAGPFGQTLRRAGEDRAFIQDVLARLGKIEREMLPDVEPTANALTERVAALGTMLHRLDTDVSGTTLAQLDRRIESLRAEPATRDRDRHITLLERQRATLHDLLERRRTLANQLESASLLLQNLKFDLLKLRSAGIGAALSDVTSVTQEARALSRDIGHVLDAAEDVRKL